MRHSGKTVRPRVVRSRGGRSVKSNSNVDFEVFRVWLGLSLLQERFDGDGPRGQPPTHSRPQSDMILKNR